MKAVIQRARDASVVVEGLVTGKIAKGMVLFLGVEIDEAPESANRLASKIARLRIFPDSAGVANLSLLDTGYSALVISQFTLMADTSKGNRPSFVRAAPPEDAERGYNQFVSALESEIGADRVATGKFGAMMDVALVNEGPYTLSIDRK